MGFCDLHEPEDGRDRFFLYAMIVLPFLSSGCYAFDAWFNYVYHSGQRTYTGLLSTILIVFSYLQYHVPIRSKYLLAVYYILLWMISETATIGYLLFYIKEKEVFKICIYSGFFLLEIYFTTGLLYCRVYKNLESNIVVENKHLFHFMSRLEVILTIFIPVFATSNYTSLTRNTVAFFLLFDFFSDSYSRFQGVWIKSALYLFVTTVTVAVAAEWFYFNEQNHVYEMVTFIAELISAFLCDSIIIIQFFRFHFKPDNVRNIFKLAVNYLKEAQRTAINNGEAFTNISFAPVKDSLEIPTLDTVSSDVNDLQTDGYSEHF